MAHFDGLPYSAAMTDSSDPDALARRYLDLWEEQMAAWASDAALADVLRLWLGLVGVDRFAAGGRGDGAPGPGRTDDERTARSATAADAPRHRDHDMAEFAQRLAALEQRLAAVEAGIPGAGERAGRSARRRRAKGVLRGPRRRD